MKLSDNQRAHLVRLGLAVDEIEFRCEAQRRVSESTRDAIRKQRERASLIDDQLESWDHRREALAGNRDAAVRESSLASDRETALRHVATLERQLQESSEKSTELVAFFSPLRNLFEQLLAHAGVSADDLGIPRGHPTPRSVRADYVIGAAR